MPNGEPAQPRPFQPLGDYAPPPMPTDDVARGMWERLKEAVSRGGDEPFIKEDQLRRVSQSQSDGVSESPVCEPLLRELDLTLSEWAGAATHKSPAAGGGVAAVRPQRPPAGLGRASRLRGAGAAVAGDASPGRADGAAGPAGRGAAGDPAAGAVVPASPHGAGGGAVAAGVGRGDGADVRGGVQQLGVGVFEQGGGGEHDPAPAADVSALHRRAGGALAHRSRRRGQPRHRLPPVAERRNPRARRRPVRDRPVL